MSDKPVGPTPLRKPDAEAHARAQAHFAELRREREIYENELPKIREQGVNALTRLLNIAQGDSGQCRHVAAFLLSLYNGNRFKMDLTDFRCLDRTIFEDCLTVLKMDYQPAQEVHCYFKNGGKIWEQLAKDWSITDHRLRSLYMKDLVGALTKLENAVRTAKPEHAGYLKTCAQAAHEVLANEGKV